MANGHAQTFPLKSKNQDFRVEVRREVGALLLDAQKKREEHASTLKRRFTAAELDEHIKTELAETAKLDPEIKDIIHGSDEGHIALIRAGATLREEGVAAVRPMAKAEEDELNARLAFEQIFDEPFDPCYDPPNSLEGKHHGPESGAL